METHIWLPPMPASWVRGRTQKGRKMAEEAALPASPEADSPVLSGMFLALSSCWPGLEPTLGASVSQEVLCGPLEQHLEPSLSSWTESPLILIARDGAFPALGHWAGELGVGLGILAPQGTPGAYLFWFLMPHMGVGPAPSFWPCPPPATPVSVWFLYISFWTLVPQTWLFYNVAVILMWSREGVRAVFPTPPS